MNKTAKHKICKRCNSLKSVSKFSKHKRRKDGLQDWCNECQRAICLPNSAKRRIERRDEFNLSQRKYQWRKQGINISVDGYNRKFLGQKGCCAICGRHQSEFNQALSVDHNHETGQVRSLVCILCNLIIGHKENRKDLMEKVDAYLTSWAKQSISA